MRLPFFLTGYAEPHLQIAHNLKKEEVQMDMGLQNRIVFVTGSSSGIGRASAIAFGREGAKVVVSYHNNRRGAEETA